MLLCNSRKEGVGKGDFKFLAMEKLDSPEMVKGGRKILKFAELKTRRENGKWDLGSNWVGPSGWFGKGF